MGFDISTIDRAEIVSAFQYLDDYRDSGTANVMEGARDLEQVCGFNRTERSAVFGAWARTFDGTTDLEGRVARALEASA